MNTAIIDRYLADVRAVKDAHARGSIGSSQADEWIAELDEALFSDISRLAQIEQEFVNGHVLIGSQDA